MTQTKPPIVVVSERVEKLEQQKVTYREATVLAVHALTSTFDADVAGAGRLDGIPAQPSFMPKVGDVVRLSLSGAVPIYQPHRIGEGAVGVDELAPEFKEQLEADFESVMVAANGKNVMVHSLSAPTSSTPGATEGDSWFQINTSRVRIGSWVWDGDSWESHTFGDQVLESLTASKIVSDQITANLLIVGQLATASSGQRAGIDALGHFAYDASSALSVRLDGVNNLIRGQLLTGPTGTRRVIVGGSGNESSIRLVAPDGTTSFVRSSNESGIGGEGLQLGLTISGAPSKWNSIHLTQQEWASYHSKIHDMVFQDRWAIAQTVDRGAASEYRVLVDNAQIQFRAGGIGGVNAWWQFNMANANTTHRFAAGSQLRASDGGAGESPKQSFVAPDGFGVLVKAVTVGGVFFEVRNIFDNGFLGVRASAFEINSDPRGKHDMRDAPIAGALAQLDAIKPKKFRRKHAGDRPVLDEDGQIVAVIEEDGPEEIGVDAQEMPEYAVTVGADGELSINLVRWLLLLTTAVQELDKKGGPKK